MHFLLKAKEYPILKFNIFENFIYFNKKNFKKNENAKTYNCFVTTFSPCNEHEFWTGIPKLYFLQWKLIIVISQKKLIISRSSAKWGKIKF